MPRIKDFCLISLVGALLALGACTTSPGQFFSTEEAATYDDSALARGDVSLDCDSLLCSFRWLTKQSTLAALYDEGDWEALTEQVTTLQYGQDLAYFYLGRAAEEQQAYDAAQLYYTRAQSATLRCSSGLFNRCRDIDVEVSSRERGEQIAVMLAASDMDLADAQQILSDMGLYTAKVDGLYGPRTRGALQQFQERRRLSKTGKLDDATIRALAEAEASARRKVAAAPGSRPVAAPESEPAEATPEAVASATPKPDATAQRLVAARAPSPKGASSSGAAATGSAPKVIDPAPAVAKSTAPKAAEPVPVVAQSTAQTAAEPASVIAKTPAPKAPAPAPVVAEKAAPTTVQSNQVLVHGTAPQAVQTQPLVVTGTPYATAAPMPLATISNTPSTTDLTPVPLRMMAPRATSVPARAPELEGVGTAPAASGLLAEASATGPEVSPAVDGAQLPAARAIDARSFEQDREAGRTRLKLEVDLLSQADPFAEVVGIVEQGAWVDVIDWGSEWSKVSHGDSTGYVYTEALQ